MFKKIFPFLFLLTITGCDIFESSDDIADGEWLIPKSEIFDGGPGKDGIPSIDNPEFIPINDVDFLSDDDLVIGIRIGNSVRAYPHPILDWHEIVNDDINGKKVAVTYCPLTGTAIGWDRDDIGTASFGVSGLLYNTNLIPYDRNTNSNWSQMLLKCVNGALIGKEIDLVQVIETTFGTWKKMYPFADILSTNTGFSRRYGIYPYGDYRTSNDLIFPVNNVDSRLAKKERVHGLIHNGATRVYRISNFTSGVDVKNEEFNGLDLVVTGSSSDNFAAVYDRKLKDGKVLEFTSVKNAYPVVMEDTEGNRWDIFGVAVSGPREGEVLNRIKSYTAYWFAWAAFYPAAEIF